MDGPWHGCCPSSFRLGQGKVFGLVDPAFGEAQEAEETAMIEFFQNYGLWIVLAGVFFTMHRFGVGCCGTTHHRKLPQNDKASHDEETDGKPVNTASGSARSCHWQGARKDKGMATRKRSEKQLLKSKIPSRWKQLLISGGLVLALTVGAGTWLFLYNPAPVISAAQYKGGPKLAVDKDFIDFGSVSFERFVTARFHLKNVGDQPLRLAVDSRVEAIEGCWPSKAVVGSTTLAPGQETEVSTEFTMHAGMGGPHLFAIHLQTNDPAEREKALKIRSLWQWSLHRSEGNHGP
jgi:hypothetical protein